MNIRIRSLVFAFTISLLSSGCGGDTQKIDPPQKKDLHLFLLAGQSNMAGRGVISEEDQKIHPRIFMLSKGGKWKPAVDPIHYDKNSAGLGLAKSFAITLANQDSNITIGLVPAACGGSPISSWTPGGYHDPTKSHPYDDALLRIREAMKDGVIKGILWHQGESDSKQNLAINYKSNLKTLIQRFRSELNAADVPFIIGQLGQFQEAPWNNYKKIVNEAHIEIANEVEWVGFVPSDNLNCMPDNEHFDSKSLKEFGRRYAKVFLDISI